VVPGYDQFENWVQGEIVPPHVTRRDRITVSEHLDPGLVTSMTSSVSCAVTRRAPHNIAMSVVWRSNLPEANASIVDTVT